MKIKQTPRVLIDAEAMERIWQWTALASGEFSCLAMVSGELLVHGVELFDQVCTAASTELDQMALAKFLCRHDKPEAVRAWIHSHGNLGTFWSDQDEECIAGLANESFLVSIVVNKRHELRCRLDVFAPVRLTLDEVELEVRALRPELKAECTALFNKHVTEAQPLGPRIPMGHRQQWHGQQAHPQQQQQQRVVMQGWPGFDDDDNWEWR